MTDRGILQSFLDNVKQARTDGKLFLEQQVHFPRLFSGDTSHVKVLRDNTRTIVEQVYSDEAIKQVFDKWHSAHQSKT